MTDIILFSYYPIDRDKKTVWRVYGHKAPGDNILIDEYESEEEAMDCAFRYSYVGIPAIRGRNYDALLEKLSK